MVASQPNPAPVSTPHARVSIGIGEMHVSKDPRDVIATHALGSCLGLTVWDPVVKVGGLLHVMLPDSATSPEKAARTPCLFVDTGVPRLFRACYELGADKRRLVVRVAGGAATFGNGDDVFQTGKRNILALRNLLWKNGVMLGKTVVGGSTARSVWLSIGDGTMWIREATGVLVLDAGK